MQFIVAGPETWKDAKARPGKRNGLMVRVAGYSAYFVPLTRGLQDKVIARTGNVKI